MSIERVSKSLIQLKLVIVFFFAYISNICLAAILDFTNEYWWEWYANDSLITNDIMTPCLEITFRLVQNMRSTNDKELFTT